MASALKALATTTLGSGTSTVSLSSIVGTYRDLVLQVNGSCTSSGQVLKIQFNGDTASNYPYIYAYGNGTSAASNAGTTGQIYGAVLAASNALAIYTLNIMDYSATDKHKTVLTRASEAGSAVEMIAGRWANTAAITSITVSWTSGSFTSGSTISLYGVSA